MSRWRQLAFPLLSSGRPDEHFSRCRTAWSPLGTLGGWGPYSRSLQFTGESITRDFSPRQFVRCLLRRHGRGVVLAADLTLYRDFQHLMDQLLEIKGRVGQLFQLGRRDCEV